MWLYSVTSICFLCLSVGSVQNCNGRTDCKCCVDGKCDPTDKYPYYCKNGCIDGYKGQQCYLECPQNCKACTREYISKCTKCRDGYFLGINKDCKGRCPENCKACNSTSYCSECKEGFNNEGLVSVCQYSPCPSNCKCKNSTCSACKDGFYDTSESCGNKCPTNCITCTSSDKCTKCKVGYYNGFNFGFGATGESETCGHKCRNSCVSCTSNNNCTQCTVGRYGSTCEHVCSVGCMARNCSRVTGECKCRQNFTGLKCEDCVPGKFGTFCNNSCPQQCKNVLCEKNYGTCTNGCITSHVIGSKCSGCATGWYGKFCDTKCPKNCKNNKCDRHSGECVDGCAGNFVGSTCKDCISGKYGSDCKFNCSKRCKGGNCTKESGYCFACTWKFAGIKCEYCSFGFYGLNCEARCSEHCSNDTCDRYTGECDGGCKGNYTGDKCCAENGRCLHCATNTECSVCMAGFFGLSCENECPLGCARSCSITTGICDACKIDFYGRLCNDGCSENCSDIPRDASRCEQYSGACIAGCKTGTFGPTCNKTCSEYCIDYVCNQDSGACEKGCKNGYDAPICHANLGKTQVIYVEKSSEATVAVLATFTAVFCLALCVLVGRKIIKKMQRKPRKNTLQVVFENSVATILNKSVEETVSEGNVEYESIDRRQLTRTEHMYTVIAPTTQKDSAEVNNRVYANL